MRHMHANQLGYAVSHSIGMRSVNGTSHKLKWVVDVVLLVYYVYVAGPGSRGVVGNPAGFFPGLSLQRTLEMSGLFSVNNFIPNLSAHVPLSLPLSLCADK